MNAPPSRRAAWVGLAAAVAAFGMGASCKGSDERRPLTACTSANAGATKSTFHGSAARLGWSDREPGLTSDRVAKGMRSAWTSAPFDTLEIGGVTYVGRTYASPLYADGIPITRGLATGAALSVVYVATSNGDVYALAASDAACANGTASAGTVLWHTRIVAAAVPPTLDGRDRDPPLLPGIAVGTLATPVLDTTSSPPVLYVNWSC